MSKWNRGLFANKRVISLNVLLLTACFFWYLMPIIFLGTYWNIFLPTYSVSLIFFLTGLLLGAYFSSSFAVVDRVKLPEKLIWLSCIISLFFVLLLQSIPLSKILSGDVDTFYRNLIFEDSTALFGSSMLYTLYNVILIPMVIFGLCITPTLKRTGIWFFWFMVILLVFDAVIRFGRFPIMYVIFFIAFNFRFLKINLKLLILLAVPLIVGMQYLLFMRQFDFQNAVFNYEFILMTFTESVLHYNLIGPLLFEYYVDNEVLPVSLSNFTSFSSLIIPVELIAGRFGEVLWYPWKDQIIALSQPIYIEALQREVNAFGTNFMPLYLDFSFLGPFMLGLWTGFMFAIRAVGRLAFATKSMTAFITFFGVYQSYIVMPYMLFVLFPVFFGFLNLKKNVTPL